MCVKGTHTKLNGEDKYKSKKLKHLQRTTQLIISASEGFASPKWINVADNEEVYRHKKLNKSSRSRSNKCEKSTRAPAFLVPYSTK